MSSVKLRNRAKRVVEGVAAHGAVDVFCDAEEVYIVPADAELSGILYPGQSANNGRVWVEAGDDPIAMNFRNPSGISYRVRCPCVLAGRYNEALEPERMAEDLLLAFREVCQ